MQRADDPKELPYGPGIHYIPPKKLMSGSKSSFSPGGRGSAIKKNWSGPGSGFDGSRSNGSWRKNDSFSGDRLRQEKVFGGEMMSSFEKNHVFPGGGAGDMIHLCYDVPLVRVVKKCAQVEVISEATVVPIDESNVGVASDVMELVNSEDAHMRSGGDPKAMQHMHVDCMNNKASGLSSSVVMDLKIGKYKKINRQSVEANVGAGTVKVGEKRDAMEVGGDELWREKKKGRGVVLFVTIEKSGESPSSAGLSEQSCGDQ
jgi:hypothetical protein